MISTNNYYDSQACMIKVIGRNLMVEKKVMCNYNVHEYTQRKHLVTKIHPSTSVLFTVDSAVFQ